MNGYDKIFNEINEKLIKPSNYVGDILCKIKYKYDFDNDYSIEIVRLTYDDYDDTWIWNSDWCEGQDDCILVWAAYISDIDNVVVDDNCICIKED